MSDPDDIAARMRARLQDSERMTRVTAVASACFRKARDLGRSGRLALAYNGRGTLYAQKCFQAERRAMRRAGRMVNKAVTIARVAAAQALAEQIAADLDNRHSRLSRFMPNLGRAFRAITRGRPWPACEP